eukprot:GFKZ01004469.1.p2 GENE.GFKZ01004469.1~~GFKZ01004469.1.p2  ORF type:complete len:211 (+),score=22.87 GFKZ01004469.1:339-971(+)
MAPAAFLSALPLTHVAHSRSKAACPLKPAQCTMQVKVPTAFKKALLDTVAPLDFGRAVFNDQGRQDEIEELARQVEATNPSPSPGTDPNLSASWELVYTTSASIIGASRPPFFQPTRIVQEINADQLTARNLEFYKFGPLQITNSVEAKLEPVSANRFDVNFVRFVVFGFIPIDVEKNDRFRGWLEVTYLDDDLRVSRGNRGNLFVLVKK